MMTPPKYTIWEYHRFVPAFMLVGVVFLLTALLFLGVEQRVILSTDRCPIIEHTDKVSIVNCPHQRVDLSKNQNEINALYPNVAIECLSSTTTIYRRDQTVCTVLKTETEQ